MFTSDHTRKTCSHVADDQVFLWKKKYMSDYYNIFGITKEKNLYQYKKHWMHINMLWFEVLIWS